MIFLVSRQSFHLPEFLPPLTRYASLRSPILRERDLVQVYETPRHSKFFSGSFAVHPGNHLWCWDHLRSSLGIICGRGHLRPRDHLQRCTVILTSSPHVVVQVHVSQQSSHEDRLCLCGLHSNRCCHHGDKRPVPL